MKEFFCFDQRGRGRSNGADGGSSVDDMDTMDRMDNMDDVYCPYRAWEFGGLFSQCVALG